MLTYRCFLYFPAFKLKIGRKLNKWQVKNNFAKKGSRYQFQDKSTWKRFYLSLWLRKHNLHWVRDIRIRKSWVKNQMSFAHRSKKLPHGDSWERILYKSVHWAFPRIRFMIFKHHWQLSSLFALLAGKGGRESFSSRRTVKRQWPLMGFIWGSHLKYKQLVSPSFYRVLHFRSLFLPCKEITSPLK